ncbi:hypothetical protein [Pokkaliibacter plantistimulans]|uniref:hypothetical protein n=1 Tax=Pokkaliibacter plantistimulans TaxID=1635171 RepID=UPI001057D5FF|nr:hypothetical protein [Pokkaliibacter plantistimulans]
MGALPNGWGARISHSHPVPEAICSWLSIMHRLIASLLLHFVSDLLISNFDTTPKIPLYAPYGASSPDIAPRSAARVHSVHNFQEGGPLIF